MIGAFPLREFAGGLVSTLVAVVVVFTLGTALVALLQGPRY